MKEKGREFNYKGKIVFQTTATKKLQKLSKPTKFLYFNVVLEIVVRGISFEASEEKSQEQNETGKSLFPRPH